MHRPAYRRKRVPGVIFYQFDMILRILPEFCASGANPAISQYSYTPLFPLEIPTENNAHQRVPGYAENSAHLVLTIPANPRFDYLSLTNPDQE
jgi:hypothetical protein